VKKSEQFCQKILGLKIPKIKALCNLVLSLSSNKGGKSVVSLSENKHYYYEYSSITDAIDGLYTMHPEWSLEDCGEEALRLEKKLLGLVLEMLHPNSSGFILLNTDITSIIRHYTTTLPDNHIVYKPNVRIRGQKPIDIGYEYSSIGYSAGKDIAKKSSWNVPLSIRRIKTGENKNSFTATQVKEVVELIGGTELIVNALDSAYSTPEYLGPSSEIPNLVSIVRFASNRNVWEGLSKASQLKKRKTNTSNKGANAVYGTSYKLSDYKNWGISPIKEQRFDYQLSNGRQVEVLVELWGRRKIRTKRGISMKDKSFNLIRIQLYDKKSKEPIYKKSLWLSVWGKRSNELSLKSIFFSYRKRFDIEHFFRFGKQRLLMDKYQTPDQEHLDNWMKIVQLAYWLLWVAEQEARTMENTIPKWQKYLKREHNRRKYNEELSPTQVQNVMELIISSFELDPYIPKSKKNGTGRKKGQTQTKRTKYKIKYKGKKKKKTANSS
jgi:hypothetical protein